MELEQGSLALVGKLLSAARKDLRELQGKADPAGFPWTGLSGLGGMTPASPSSAETMLPMQNGTATRGRGYGQHLCDGGHGYVKAETKLSQPLSRPKGCGSALGAAAAPL